jgi:Bacterial regulatory protein, Fis family
MVRTILLAGVGRAWATGTDVTILVSLLGAEALDILARRSCDAIAIGNVPDLAQADLAERVHARYPRLPIVLVGDSVPVITPAWEHVPPSSLDRLRAVLERASELGWLRREYDRLAQPSAETQPRDVELTFEQGSIREMERLMIVGRLERLNQNRTRSAESLDISVRTLRNKLREYRTRIGATVEKRSLLTD